MNKLYALVVLPMLMALSCNSQEKPLEKSLLWEISGNGLEKSSYLFGTYHAVCNAELPKKVHKAIDKSEVVVLEIDMDDLDYSSIDPNSMLMKGDKSLSDFLDKEQLQKLDAFYSDNAGIDIKPLYTSLPFILNTVLYPALYDCELQAVDTAVMNKGLYNEKEILGLETFQSQMAIFDSIPYQAQVDDLMHYVDNGWDALKEEMDTMIQDYYKEDIQGLFDFMIAHESSLTSKYLDIFLYDRNKAWIPQIESLSKETAAFYAVGAGHLAGKEGVIKLLRKRGFTVTPIFE